MSLRITWIAGPAPGVSGSGGALLMLAGGPHLENCCLLKVKPGAWQAFWIECAWTFHITHSYLGKESCV